METPGQIRVLLVDDSVFVLHGLKTILKKTRSIVIVGTARTHAEALTAFRQCRPDVVLLDVHMGAASGIGLCEAIKGAFPSVGILFLTACQDRDLFRSAINAGAQGYLLKSCSAGEIAKAVETISEGKAVIDPRLIPQVMAWIRDEVQLSRPQRTRACSKADHDVLSGMAATRVTKKSPKIAMPRPTRARRLFKASTRG
ncbi:MAG: response regulator transcription factor [Nitrospira sp.]|nr:response regulator transcription factor [Nitrospira sp.]